MVCLNRNHILNWIKKNIISNYFTVHGLSLQQKILCGATSQIIPYIFCFYFVLFFIYTVSGVVVFCSYIININCYNIQDHFVCENCGELAGLVWLADLQLVLENGNSRQFDGMKVVSNKTQSLCVYDHVWRTTMF